MTIANLDDLAQGFTEKVSGRQGRIARANGTFFSVNAVSTAIQRIRLDAMKGARLTDAGHAFIEQAAAYLAGLARSNWQRRGLAVAELVDLAGPPERRQMTLAASRTRDGQREHLSVDVLRDVRELMIHVPRLIPFMRTKRFIVSSLVYPSPEYLYTFGLFLLDSGRASGNWPQSPRVGGLEQDFATSKQLMVDDLHADLGLPKDDAALRQLSLWVVFPPYGYEMNDGQEYNMMTLVNQTLAKRVVPLDAGVGYLRALLDSQLVFLRNLAARTLLVLGQPPRTEEETTLFTQALRSNDFAVARSVMARFQWRAEHLGSPDPPPPDWEDRCAAGWQRLVDGGPQAAWRSAPMLHDPEYMRVATLAESEPARVPGELERLLARHPGDWFLRSALGAQLMQAADPARGEQLLRGCLLDAPDCADAHLKLGTRLKWQGRRDEAMQIFEEAVRRWPWNAQAVDSCMWLLTDDMVAPA